jgi:hypothetical protein
MRVGLPVARSTRYTPDKSMAETSAPPVPLGSISVAVLNGKIHTVGGRNTQCVDLAPLPQPLDYIGQVTAGRKLYAVGG